jgi:transcriptional regulator with GAF, ATPase, and Fis domain
VSSPAIEQRLHAADAGALDREIMALALEATGADNGALFLWDDEAGGLVIACHVVSGLTVTIPDVVLKRGERPGIALQVHETNRPYLCDDTSVDPHYTRFLLDVGSIAAVPIGYQDRPIGVITVSDPEPGRFSERDLEALAGLAASAATFVRRVQIDRQSRARLGRPFLIKGLSPEWLEVERRIEHAAPTEAPILIRGESGTGKDLVATSIHFNSRRAPMPLVTVNCAAIPETMLESILFGHVKGAFTGASFNKIGEFQKADGGTLFLDEVGELPVMLQAKVLRAVEHGEVQPLGSNQAPVTVDVRLIGATNRDLEQMARDGEFREDLYYRLGVMTMELPPLRSYKDNLETLAHVFVQQAAEKHGKKAPRISSEAMALIRAHDYPGNVRELKNAMEHAVIMAVASGRIGAAELPRPFRPDGAEERPRSIAATADRLPLREQRERWLAPLEREYLTELLEETNGNVREAASRAGINPVTFYRLLKKRGLQLRRGLE